MSFPILYDKMETEFGHLGLGVLRDAISCIVTEERNGVFELEMEYPISGALFNLLENDRIIKVDAGHELKEQRFRIKRITKKMNGIVEVYAEHVSYLTQDLTLTPEIELRGNAQQALNQWKNNIIDHNPFEVFSDVALDSATKLKIQDFETARRVLGGVQGSILDIWGGEYKFDNYRISLLENRGSNSNTLISYGRNLTDLDQEDNIANTFTSLYPFAIYRNYSEDGSSSDEQLITIDGYIVDSEHVNKYPNRRILPIDFSSEFESDAKPTQARLRALAEQYIQSNNVGVPKVSLNVSFVDLTKSLDFNGLHYEQVNLCDVVPIYFEKLGIRARAKINRIRWDVLLGQYESLEIGDARMTLSDKIRDLEDDINNIGNRPPVIGGENIANITPRPVTNFRAVGGFEAIHIFWDNQGFTVSHFELYRSMVSGFTPDENTRIYRGRGNGFIDTVGANRQYFYRCRAINFHGVVGGWSNEAMAQTATFDLSDLEDRLDDLNNNVLPELNQNLEDLNKELNEAMKELESSLELSREELEQAIQDALNKTADFEDRLKENEDFLSDLNDNILPSLQDNLDNLEESNSQLQDDLADLNKSLEESKNSINNITKDLINVSNQMSQLDNALSGLDDLLDNWRYLDTVEIDGGALRANTVDALAIRAGSVTAREIMANSISGDKLQVNSITTRELTLADFSNLSQVDELRGFDPSLGGNTWTVFGWHGRRWIRNGHETNMGTHSIRIFVDRENSFRLGEQFTFQFIGFRSGSTPTNVRIRARYFYSDGEVNAGLGTPTLLPNAPTANDPVSLACNVEITTSRDQTRELLHCDILFEFSPNNNGFWNIRETGLFRRNNAQMIVDGAILTNHMTAGSIDADRLVTNSITSDLVRSDAIEARHIQAGSIETDHMDVNSINGDRLTINTLNGDRLISNTITAREVASNSITTSHLTITDFTNFATANENMPNSIITENRLGFAQPVITVGPDGLPRLSQAITTHETLALCGTTPSRFRQGDSFTVEFDIWVISVGNPTFQIRRGMGNEHLGTTSYPITGIVAGSWTSISFNTGDLGAVWDLPESTHYAFGLSGFGSSTVYVRNATIRQRSNGRLIVDGAIHTNHMTTGSIDADRLVTNSITSDLIKANAITANHIQADAITANHIGADVITANHIGADQIEALHIQAGEILSEHIRAGQVRADHLAVGILDGHTLNAVNINGSFITGGSLTSQINATSPRVTIQNGNIDIGVGSGVATRLSGRGLRWTVFPNASSQLNQLYVDMNWGEFSFPGMARGWNGICTDIGNIGDFAIVSGVNNKRGLLWATQNAIHLDAAQLWNTTFQNTVSNGNAHWRTASGTLDARIGTTEVGNFHICSGGTNRVTAHGTGATITGTATISGNTNVSGNLDVNGNIFGNTVSSANNGWINLAVNTNLFWHFQSSGICRVRCINNIVEVQAELTPRPNAINNLQTTTTSLMFTLPVGFRPTNAVSVVHSPTGAGATSVNARWNCTLNPSGTVTANRCTFTPVVGNANGTGTLFRMQATFTIF